MDRISAAERRVRGSGSVPELLAAGFDAFEEIRLVARDCEDRAAELFAPFLMAAGAATEGRNALVEAPSLPRFGGSPGSGPPVDAATDVEQVADELAELAKVLTARMSEAVDGAANAEDRGACVNAANAAREIHRLLAGASDATPAR
jgi:hypothetical protein